MSLSAAAAADAAAPTTTAVSGADEAEPRRSRRRTVLAWVAIGLVLLILGAIGAAFSRSGEWSMKDRLDPEATGPTGARALAEILREQGVDVEVVRSIAAARDEVTARDTLVMASTDLLADEDLSSITGRAANVVLLDPSARDVDLLVANSELAGYGPFDEVEPQCDLRAATRAGAIVLGGLFDPGSAASGCYATGDGYGLIGTATTVAIDGTELFTNARLAEGSNAGLALGLLGQNPRVVWYMPSFDDAQLVPTERTIGDLTPPWVTPVLMLLLFAGGVAAFWRGRRFGPLVVERLPVTVRASETMEGRARLYARSRDATHAADALRQGTAHRIAKALGLGPTADPATIADAAADRLGTGRDVVRGILLPSSADGDTDLVAVSDRLRDLETAVAASVRIERTDP